MAINYTRRQIDDLINEAKSGRNGKMHESIRQDTIYPDTSKTFQDPVFSYFLIDVSFSMDRCKKAVIEYHPLLFNALRESRATKEECNFIAQYMFNHEITKLHDFTLLATNADMDEVVILDEHNYKPKGGTALYDTLYYILDGILKQNEVCAAEGLAPKFNIGLISDGIDEDSKIPPEIIREMVGDIREMGLFKMTAVVGLLGDSYPESSLEETRKTIGFDKTIPCDHNNQKEIRMAFELLSNSAV